MPHNKKDNKKNAPADLRDSPIVPKRDESSRDQKSTQKTDFSKKDNKR